MDTEKALARLRMLIKMLVASCLWLIVASGFGGAWFYMGVGQVVLVVGCISYFIWCEALKYIRNHIIRREVRNVRKI